VEAAISCGAKPISLLLLHELSQSQSTWALQGVGAVDLWPSYRFSELRMAFPFAFYDFEAKDNGDPWHPVGLLVDGYNKNRFKKIAASVLKVLDESMSAFRPRTTKKGSYLGGLPHISFILRKPEPLGTEFKVICCATTGVFLHIEIQRGKIPRNEMKYSKKFGATAACTLRLID
jgi:hypothetical protein